MAMRNELTLRLGLDAPILQAPMAGAQGSALAIAVSEAGGLGALPCAMLSAEQIRAEAGIIRQRVGDAFNMNFFCHRAPEPDAAREQGWRRRLAPYYRELGLDPEAPVPAASRQPFDSAACALVEEFRPRVASFHFGLPAPDLVARVKAAGCFVIASATSADEARWLETHGADAIIAQGVEAGGHRGMFLETDLARQAGTMALVPQVVDAVRLPVIAAGGIADARGIAAAFALGASAVQLGTAYLFTPEATISGLHRVALKAAKDNGTVLTNVLTGRPARSLLSRVVRDVGPISPDAPAFPNAAAGVGPLRAAAEKMGSGDFSPLWSGQAAALAREEAAGALTRRLAEEAQARLAGLSA